MKPIEPSTSATILRMLAELSPLAESRAEKRDADTRLQHARDGFRKRVSDLEIYVGRIERAVIEGAQVCSPEQIELSRAALIKTAKLLVEVASKIEAIMSGPMIGEEDEERRRA